MIAIAAMSPERVIGAHGRIPWHVSADLKFFKRMTTGHVIVMGRKTYESLGRPLPNRENWVVSRTATPEGVRVFRDPAAVCEPEDGRSLFVIGGAELYTAMLPRTQEILLTRVETRVEGDTWFPEFESEFDAGEVLETGEGYEIRRHRRQVAHEHLTTPSPA